MSAAPQALDRCEYCNAPGCEWTRHPKARADVAAWQREARALAFPFGDHTHDAELLNDDAVIRPRSAHRPQTRASVPLDGVPVAG